MISLRSRLPFDRGTSRHAARVRVGIAGWLAVVGLCAVSADVSAQFDGYDFEPINYVSSESRDPVAELARRIESGEAELRWDTRLGYLPALLAALDVSPASQMLVYSKTSFQLKRISPRSPRAIYFNDEVYIGYVPGGDLIEISAVDPKLGGVFYVLEQRPPDAAPAQDDADADALGRAVHAPIQRRINDCLQCHASPQTQSVPGHMVRSVYTDSDGFPVLTAKTFISTHRSPLEERWGGWYVTGTHGKARHLGNVLIPADTDPEAFDFASADGGNVTDLAGRFDAALYPAATSDIVALMVLEHQTQMHNLITKAAYQTRIALQQQAELNAMSGRPADEMTDSTRRRIQRHGEALLRYLLFVDEAFLSDPIAGTSGFAESFQKAGVRDPHGRSLRDLDLRKYLFKYPCSYLIHSAAFDAMPREMKDYVYGRLFEILTDADESGEYMISTPKRRAIYEILMHTKDDLPPQWTAENRP